MTTIPRAATTPPVTIQPIPGDEDLRNRWIDEQEAPLRAERETLLASQPDISGNRWASGVAAGVSGLGTLAGLGYTIDRFIVEPLNRKIPSYDTWSGFRNSMGGMGVALIAAALVGAGVHKLVDAQTRPDGDALQKILDQHRAAQQPRIAELDQQIAELEAARPHSA